MPMPQLAQDAQPFRPEKLGSLALFRLGLGFVFGVWGLGFRVRVWGLLWICVTSGLGVSIEFYLSIIQGLGFRFEVYEG